MIRWTNEGATDLSNIVTWPHERNPAAAEWIGEEILNAIQGLVAFTNMGRQGKRAGTRELVIARRHYIVVYAIVNDVVVILRVNHDAMNWPS